MKAGIKVPGLIAAFGIFCGLTMGGEKKMEQNIKWLGHSSILIEKDGKNIYVDPWKLKSDRVKAELILITHPHYDHFSVEDINKIITEKTVIVAPADCIGKISKGIRKNIEPGTEIDLIWVTIAGVAAYNINKQYHPKSNHWVGYVIKFADTSIYVAGDTDFIPEMKHIKADIVILPVGGTYTMDAQEAATAVNTIKPRIAIPIHFGDIVGSRSDAEKFASLVKAAQVKILTPEK
ncbi:MAG: MBL fold metallo-hydrolase [Candidatus Omnitrophica bacterium]|nr:MBL fold metallo-hydrolase [Candidatus Omnitrophota bacterium]